MAYSHNDVAHAWANQTRESMRGFNMFFEGPVIYSYGKHFPIARHYTVDDSEWCVLFTTHDYSISTSKHKSIVSRACNHLPTFVVPNVCANSALEHRENFDAYYDRMIAAFEKARRARVDWSRAHEIKCALAARTNGNDYKRWFNIRSGDIEIPSEYAVLTAWFTEYNAMYLQREAAEAAQREARAAEDVEKWKRGEIAQCPHTRTIHLRVKKNAVYDVLNPVPSVYRDVIETSWGARVPVEDAIKLFQHATDCKVRQRDIFKTGGCILMHIGEYELRKIDNEGNVTVGCHHIKYDEMHRIAQQLGVA